MNIKQLNPEQLKGIIAHIEKTWGKDRPCPMCGHVEWNIEPTVYSLPAFNFDGPLGQQTFQPLIVVACRNCFSIQFINPVLVGILSQADFEKPAPVVRSTAKEVAAGGFSESEQGHKS